MAVWGSKLFIDLERKEKNMARSALIVVLLLLGIGSVGAEYLEIEDLVAEQQRIADTIVKLKGEIKQVHDSVGDKEVKIQELAGKLDVLVIT